MIWATVADVRAYLSADDRLPNDVPDELVQRDIYSAVRTLDRKAIRYPLLNDDGTVTDPETAGHVVAAVAEMVWWRRKVRAEEDALDTAAGGMPQILRGGGEIATKALRVTGPRTSGGNASSSRRERVPMDAYDALAAAGMIGGSVPTW